MTGSSHSRQVLTMDMNESAASVSFGKKNGCYLNRVAILLLLVLFLSGLIATGLLVYYYAPRIRDGGSAEQVIDAGKTTIPPTRAPPTRAPSPPVHRTTTPSPKPEKLMDVRLPRSLKPIRYVVKLQPFINGNFSIHGHVEMEMEVIEPTRNVSVHINDIITKNDTIKLIQKDDNTEIGINQHVHDKEREFYVAHLRQSLLKGRRYILSMDFEGYLNDQLHGFYRSSYKDADGNDRWMATTQFQPTDARRAFPCFDEPALKATFEIYLAREEGMSSISNMPKIHSFPIKDQPGWVWDHFNTSVPMSTYLVAFVVSDFAHKESQTKNGVGFRVWARQHFIDQAQYSLDIGGPILTFFEDYFSIPYPLPKQDMIALTDFAAGAMENWGLITYREAYMLYDPDVTDARSKERIVTIIAHELAHQWFGNLVTPSWWTDLWLNEGFASYMEFVGAHHAEPTWNMMQAFVTVDLQSVFALDCLESSHPISVVVNHPDEINEIFDKISYSKGSSVIRMMSHFLTEATFRKGLTNYLNKMKYDSAEQDDLWHYLTMAAHEDGTLPRDVTVKMIMDTWTLQMGYPVISVDRSPDGTSATVSQERFLMVKSGKSSDNKVYRWWVPLTYTSQNNPDFEATQPERWMKDSEGQVTISALPSQHQWVIFNLQETGYYRVNYDQNNWNLLVQQLTKNHNVISPNNRAQIIDDAFNLARAGLVSYRTALSVISYLAKEQNYVPISSALTAVNYLETMFQQTANYGALKKYLLNLVIPLYNTVGFEDRLSDPHLDQLKRVKAIAWACSLEHPDCLMKATELYKQWMANPTNMSIISPNLQTRVYCSAIAAGGEEEWNFAWNRYLNSDNGLEQRKLLYALGCTKKQWILSRYVEAAFRSDGPIRKQDASTAFSAISSNDVGRDIAWGYLRNNWQTIHNNFGSGIFILPRLVERGTTNLNTQEHLQQLKDFRDQNEEMLGTAKRAVDQSIERTENNIAWTKENTEEIVEWLEENGYSSVLRKSG